MNVNKMLIISIFVLTSVIQAWSSLVRTIYTKGPEYCSHIGIRHELFFERVLRFSVRTPRDARILLSTDNWESEYVFEIVLGARDNTINFIHNPTHSDDDEPRAVVRTVNLLSEQEFRNFWIRLKNDEEPWFLTLQVGIGNEDTPFLEWRYYSYRPAMKRAGDIPRFISFRSEVWAEWRWGYTDETYTEALYADDGSIRISMNQNQFANAQYFPLSELASHSDDGLTLWLRIQSNNPVNIGFSKDAGSDDLTLSVQKDSLSITEYDVSRWAASSIDSAGNVATSHGYLHHARPSILSPVNDGLGTDENPSVNYWVKFKQGGQVLVGNANSKRPILRLQTSNPYTWGYPRFVRFDIPTSHKMGFNLTIHSTIWSNLQPMDQKRHFPQDCTARWREASELKLPLGAVAGGYNDGDQLFYVCRASHFGHLLPGSYKFEDEVKGMCHISIGIEVIKKTTFQVLTGCEFGWAAASLGEIPEDAVPAGRNVSKEIIYAARVSYGGQLIIGKLHSNQRIAYVTFNDQVIPSTNYELLITGEFNWTL